MLCYEEKLLKILQAIDEAEKCTAKKQPIHLHPNHQLLSDITYLDIEGILEKLAIDEKIISLHSSPSFPPSRSLEPNNRKFCFVLTKKRRFNLFKNVVLQSPASKINLTHAKNNPDLYNPEQKLWLDYNSESGILTLNGYFQIAKTNYNSENDIVCSYLINNPNKHITIKEIEKRATFEPLKKRPHEIVRDLGFKGELSKAFFKLSKDGFYLRNPVGKDELENLGINLIKISAIPEKQ